MRIICDVNEPFRGHGPQIGPRTLKRLSSMAAVAKRACLETVSEEETIGEIEEA